MAKVQNSEVDAKPAPVSIGLSRVKFGNHGNQAVAALQWVSQSDPVFMVGDVM
jgi:hypothetical protein